MAVANTMHGDHDEFASAAAVRNWWHGLHAPDGPVPAAAVGAHGRAGLQGLRSVIRALALRNNGIEIPFDTSALDSLSLRLDLRGQPALLAGEAGDLGRDICAATVTALVRATARPSWPRLKACRGMDCGWVFVDQSRNTSRRWCDMTACGNRAKSASFRHRRAAAG